jgi:predicted XRE-type DNA-binding protein
MQNRETLRKELASIVVMLGDRMSSSMMAVQLGVDTPKVAALRNGRLAIFSLERLMHYATRLGHDVDITIRPHAPPGFRHAYRGRVRIVDQSRPRAVS